MTPLLIVEQVLNGLQSGIMLFLMAAGLTLIFGVMGLINLAHGSLFMVGAFAAAAKKQRGAFDRDAWKDATDDEKKALREKMSEGRKEWYEKMKSHREEVGKRMKEIRAEFKNNRDKVIDGNDPGE